MQKNNVTKYLLYALGEIILVVIGILIALEVNNRNEQRKSQDLEVKYLKEIRNNLTFDLSDLAFNINFNSDRLRSNRLVLDYLRGETIDSLTFHLSNLAFSTRTLVNPSGYESLKSKGLELITNDSLRSQITALYEFHIHNVVDFETKDDHAYQYNIFLPEVMKSISIDYSNIRKANTPNGIGQFIEPSRVNQNENLISAISNNVLFRQLMLEYYQRLQGNIHITIRMIDEELKTLTKD